MFVRMLAVAALLLAITPAQALAQDRHGEQFWFLFLDTHALSPKWRVHLEVQPRFTFDPADVDQTIVRTALGRVLSPRVSVWAGHAWIPRTAGTVTRHEQRLWQQLSATFPKAGKWTPSIRLRQEQRFLDGWGDNSHRSRML